MEEKNQTGIVPEQYTGRAINAESSVELKDINEAKTFFQTVKRRLEDVNNWHSLSGELTANFQLMNKDGIKVNRSIQKGDHFKIDVPGPGTKTGEGFDWVQVEEIETASTSDTESFGIRVRPAQNPQDGNSDIAHFYSSESTSSFTVTREMIKVTAAIYDRNTKTNKGTGSLTDKVRDAVVGAAGMLIFSKIQWKALTDGLVKREK